MSAFRFNAMVDNGYDQVIIRYIVYSENIENAKSNLEKYLSDNNLKLIRIEEAICIDPYEGNIIFKEITRY